MLTSARAVPAARKTLSKPSRLPVRHVNTMGTYAIFLPLQPHSPVDWVDVADFRGAARMCPRVALRRSKVLSCDSELPLQSVSTPPGHSDLLA